MAGEEGYGEEGYTVVGTEHYTASSHSVLSIALFFFLGAVAGAGLGLLLTPQSGSKTRRQLKDASRETKAVLGDYSTRILDKGKEAIREGMPLLSAAIEAGREAYEREKNEKIGSSS